MLCKVVLCVCCVVRVALCGVGCRCVACVALCALRCVLWFARCRACVALCAVLCVSLCGVALCVSCHA